MAAYLDYNSALPASARISHTIVAVNSLSPFSVTLKVRLPVLSRTIYLLGRYTNNASLWSVSPSGILTFSNGTVNVSTSGGLIPANTVTWVRLRQDTTNIYIETSTDGNTFVIRGQKAKAGGVAWDTVFCFNNTLSTGNFLYSLEYNLNGSITRWDETSAPSTGTSWPPAVGTGNITLNNFTGVPANSWWITTVILATLKYWTGSAWVRKPLKYWNGSAWVQKVLKYWNGTTWVNK